MPDNQGFAFLHSLTESSSVLVLELRALEAGVTPMLPSGAACRIMLSRPSRVLVLPVPGGPCDGKDMATELLLFKLSQVSAFGMICY